MGLKQFIRLALFVSLFSSPAMAEGVFARHDKMMCNLDKFDRYPVAVEKNLKSKKIDFSDHPQLTEKQQTYIRGVYHYGPNFNDRYTIAGSGENDDCPQFVMIDNSTGKIIFSSSEDMEENNIKICSQPFFRQSSNLILFDASCDKSQTPQAVTFENGKFVPQKLAGGEK